VLVRPLPGSLLLVRQHDHALLAGELAARWEERPSGLLVLAVALHDVAWRGLDRTPRFDPERGAPFAFTDHPLHEKLRAYREGIDRQAAVHPYTALLGSRHYSSFLSAERAGAFLSAERDRRDRLRRRLAEGGGVFAGEPSPGAGRPAVEAPGEPGGAADGRSAGRQTPESGREREERDLAWLKLFDTLSLLLCLTGPGTPAGEMPAWLRGRSLDPPAGAPGRAGGGEPDGRGAIRLEWAAPGEARFSPFPFTAPFRASVPARRLPRRRYRDPDALRHAWEVADRTPLRLRIGPGTG